MKFWAENRFLVTSGSGFELSIKDLMEKIASLTGFEGESRWNTSKPNGQPRRVLDTSRAQQALGFQAYTSFDEGLRHTVDWCLANRGQIEGQTETIQSTSVSSEL